MAEEIQLNKPWLIAVWPGMGHVAISAGYYLMAKLGMHRLAEFSAEELFDLSHVDVKAGLIHQGRLPRSQLFVWNDPAGRRDLIVFIGEAQPPIGKYAFCRRLIASARELGVERVYTFAAMATQMPPAANSRVFVAATDFTLLAELKSLPVEVLEEGHIGGLNGVLLGVAGESDVPGGCFLGEMPQMFAQVPFPKASLAVLKAFMALSGIEIDLAELSHHATHMDQELARLLAEAEATASPDDQTNSDDESHNDLDQFPEEGSHDEGLSLDDREHIEELFASAERDRASAYELKRELDRLSAYREYEDRFLDLFRKRG
jgi:proteasome assembly chaperone (PAC2) family protein